MHWQIRDFPGHGRNTVDRVAERYKFVPLLYFFFFLLLITVLRFWSHENWYGKRTFNLLKKIEIIKIFIEHGVRVATQYTTG